MYYKIVFFAFLISVIFGVRVRGDFNNPDGEKMNSRSLKHYIPAILSCSLKYDVPCLLTNAENYLDDQRQTALAEADAAVLQTRGVKNGETPSHLTSVIEKILTEISSVIKEGFSGFFRNSKDAEDDDDEESEKVEGDENEEDDEENRKSRQAVEEERGKKKKKKKFKIKLTIKLLILGAVLYAKALLLLKLLAFKVQVKFLLIALGNLLINALKVWWEFKEKKAGNPQKVIYYEHAQHQHHYDGGDEDWESSGPSSGGGGGYWGRSYVDKENGQDLAYAKSRPKQTIPVEGQTSGSWF